MVGIGILSMSGIAAPCRETPLLATPRRTLRARKTLSSMPSHVSVSWQNSEFHHTQYRMEAIQSWTAKSQQHIHQPARHDLDVLFHVSGRGSMASRRLLFYAKRNHRRFPLPPNSVTTWATIEIVLGFTSRTCLLSKCTRL